MTSSSTSQKPKKELRVLHVLAAPASGGAETFVRDLVGALTSRGLQIHVAFLDQASDLGRDQAFERKFLSDLQRSGVSFSFLGSEVRRKPWLGFLRFRRLVREKDIDLIHSHLAFGNIFSAVAPWVPLVYTHHSEEKRFATAIWMYFRLRVAHFIGISETCRQSLGRYLGSDDRVSLIMNGVRLTGIPTRGPCATQKPFKFISVGRIAPQKNYPLLARAIAGLGSAKAAEASFDVFGEGDPAIVEECEGILTDAGMPKGALRFCGVSPNLRELLRDYDAFVMSSDWEGLPIALIEAAAAGLPLIATDVGGCSEVTRKGPSQLTAGLVVPPGDSDCLGAAIKQMIENADARIIWSENARKFAMEFSICKAAELHSGIYRLAVS